MITADQIKAARKLLGWSGATLAAKEDFLANTLSRAETAALSERTREHFHRSIRRALETAGIVFTDGQSPGVKLKV